MMPPVSPPVTDASDSRVSAWVESTVDLIGRIVCWSWMALVAVIVIQVSLSVLRHNVSWMEELQWHLYGAASMIALSTTLVHGGHVRVDVWHHRVSRRTRQVIETTWIIAMLVPLMLVMIYWGFDFLRESWSVNESSPDPGGLPARYVIKAVIPAAASLLLLTGLARALRVWYRPDLCQNAGLAENTGLNENAGLAENTGPRENEKARVT